MKKDQPKVPRASLAQIERIKAKQKPANKLKREAELAMARARAADQELRAEVVHVLEECGVDPDESGWHINPDGTIVKMEPR